MFLQDVLIETEPFFLKRRYYSCTLKSDDQLRKEFSDSLIQIAMCKMGDLQSVLQSKRASMTSDMSVSMV